jgi:hypothetical protein
MQILRVAFLSLLPLCGPARAELEFVGLLATPRETKVVFRDPATGLDSGWVGVGATVQGYTVVEVKAAGDVLVLRQGNRLIELPLASAKIQGRKPDLTGEVRLTGAFSGNLSCDLLLGVPRTLPLPDGRRLTVEVRKEPGGAIAFRGMLEKTERSDLPVPLVSRRQVNTIVAAGESLVFELAPDVTVSLKL